MFIVCLVFGYLLSAKYKHKRIFYSCFKDFNIKIKNEVAFSRNTIIDILNTGDDNDFIECVKNFYEQKEIVFNKKYLKNEDLDFLNSYLIELGQGDAFSQTDYLATMLNIIEEKRLNAILEEKKYKNLYLKLSIFIGLILFVIFI